MKKSLLFGLLLFVFAVQTSAAQVCSKGRFLFDTYIGFPNFYTAVFKAAYLVSGTEVDVEITGTPPIGFRGEYFVHERISVGLDIGYNKTQLKFRDLEQYINDTTGLVQEGMFDFNFTTKRIGILACASAHILQDEQWDLYATFGLGYNGRTFSFTSTYVDFTSPSIPTLVPLAMKIGLGLRYYPAPNVGFNLGIGVGQGGLINAGVSAAI